VTLVRIWRRRESAGPVGTFSEVHEVAPPRMALTVRAVRWATDALSYDDTRFGVGPTSGAWAHLLGCRRGRSGSSGTRPGPTQRCEDPRGLFAIDRGVLPGQWVHAARRAALRGRIRAW
jgi:hypothetical protein